MEREHQQQIDIKWLAKIVFMEDIDERAGGEACAEITKEKLETSYDDDNHYF